MDSKRAITRGAVIVSKTLGGRDLTELTTIAMQVERGVEISAATWEVSHITSRRQLNLPYAKVPQATSHLLGCHSYTDPDMLRNLLQCSR